MMICFFALGFAAFALVNALFVVSVADHLSQPTKSSKPVPRIEAGAIVTKLAA